MRYDCDVHRFSVGVLMSALFVVLSLCAFACEWRVTQRPKPCLASGNYCVCFSENATKWADKVLDKWKWKYYCLVAHSSAAVFICFPNWFISFIAYIISSINCFKLFVLNRWHTFIISHDIMTFDRSDWHKLSSRLVSLMLNSLSERQLGTYYRFNTSQFMNWQTRYRTLKHRFWLYNRCSDIIKCNILEDTQNDIYIYTIYHNAYSYVSVSFRYGWCAG